MGQANINRGKKWADVRAKAIFNNDSKTVEWMDKQEAIVSDEKTYTDSIQETKSKVKK